MNHAIGNLIVPATFLIGVAVLSLNLQHLPVMPENLWLTGPSVAIAITGTLALSYNRSRVLFVCALLAFCLAIEGQDMSAQLDEIIIVAIVPLNILIICLFQERGVFTFIGLMRLALLLFEFVILMYWINLRTPLSPAILAPFPATMDPLFGLLPFNQLTTVLLLVSFVGCMIVKARDHTLITQGLTTTMLAIVIGFAMGSVNTWEIFIMAGSFYLAACIIRDSYNMAYKDELTGLPHRRALNEQLLSLGNRYALAMVDIDRFKQFNDTHGHDVGDQVLQMIGKKIRKVGGGGKAFRYGGEEFSIVFPRMGKSDAFYYLDEIRKTIENYVLVIREKPREDPSAEKHEKRWRQRGSFRHAEKTVSVTVSIGVADPTGDGPDADDVLKAADKALYSAKKKGRNQVVST